MTSAVNGPVDESGTGKVVHIFPVMLGGEPKPLVGVAERSIGDEDSTAGSDTPTGETFDPQTNLWSDISKPSSFDFVRGDCNGSVLADGRVLIGGATPSGAPPSWSKRTAIWDPHTDT
jgi:hypothetical protein